MTQKKPPPFRIVWEQHLRSDRVQLSNRAVMTGLMMATHADPDGTRIYPGFTRLAQELRVSESTVKRGIYELMDAGYLRQVAHGSRMGRERYVNVYWLAIPPEPCITGDPW